MIWSERNMSDKMIKLLYKKDDLFEAFLLINFIKYSRFY